jgi:hypothetical protein
MSIFQGEDIMRFQPTIIFPLLFLCAHAEVEFEMTVLETDLGYAHGCYTVADIDGDSLNEIVASGNSPRLWWGKYPDLEKFPIAASADVGFEVHVGDMDNDGDIDVITSGAGISWWENPLIPDGNPAGGEWQVHTFGSLNTGTNGGSHDFKVGDINNDGLLDMVERDKERPWHFYLQQPGGDFETFSVDAANNTEGTALGDLDNDGDLDITDGLAWFECPEDPANDAWTRHDLGTGHDNTRVVIADMTGNGNLDIVRAPAEFGGNDLVWFEAPSDPRNGTWNKHVIYERSDPNFHTLQVGDIDLDGNNDILAGVTNWSSHPADWRRQVFIFYNINGDGSQWEQQNWVSEMGVWQGVLGDVGSDGDLDLLTADFNTGSQFEFWENKLDPVITAVSRSYGRFTDSKKPPHIILSPTGKLLFSFPPEAAYRSPMQPNMYDLSGRMIGTITNP